MVWVESFTRAVRRYHVDSGKVEDVCVLEDPDAIPDGLKPATNGDLYIGTVLTGGVSVIGADGTDKGLLKGFRRLRQQRPIPGLHPLRHRHRGRHRRRQRIPRFDLADQLEGVTGLELFPGSIN